MSTSIKLKMSVSIVLILLFSLPAAATAATYYVDSDTGDDNNTGTSTDQAWATLDPVNAVTLGPGDSVLFKAGTRYTGRLKPQGSGAPDNPIIIDMYGYGFRPRIDCEGLFLDTIWLYNVEYYEISNLEITNLAPERIEWQTGVRITADGIGALHHIHLKNLFVHDINGSLNKRREGTAIFWECKGRKTCLGAWFDDLLIEDCYVLRADRNGICGRTIFNNRDQGYYPSYNVVVRGNLVEDVGGDGIKLWGCEGGIAEHNVVRNGRQRCIDAAAGIWPWSSSNSVIQYNEVSGMKGSLDGQAFDSDYKCENTTIQYNYSHDNDGGFVLVCGPDIKLSNIGTLNTVIRYNVSQNDHARTFHISGESCINTQIYNNIIYVGPDDNIPLILFDNWGGEWPFKTYFYNNIFYVDGTVSYVWGDAKQVIFEGNVFYGSHIDPPDDRYAVTDDPKLANPGLAPSGIYSLYDHYRLLPDSPCINSGVEVADCGGIDLWGNPVPADDITDRGVHEFQDVEPDTTAPTPDPPAWAKTPYPIRDTAVSMAAAAGYDPINIQYYFTCTAGGGHDNGWQNSPFYTDTDLLPESEYTYTVTMRDKSLAQNQTAQSSPASVLTFSPESVPPQPNPMTWSTLPYGYGDDSIRMEAAHACDQSDVEFYFECVAGDCHDSGWQDSTLYTDTGLQPDTSYTYTVKARDKSSNHNETAPSTPQSAATLPEGQVPAVYVHDIAMGYRYTGLWYAQATVWIKNNAGAAADGAGVSCQWTGDGVRESEDADATGEDGKIMFESLATKKGTFVFTVTNIAMEDCIYDPNLNVETSDSITFPIE